MPAWITSLLREEIPVPIAPAASATTTSAPVSAAARATASPTTPAPTTKTCIEKRLYRILSAMDRGVRAFQGPGESEIPCRFAIDQECRSGFRARKMNDHDKSHSHRVQ